MKKPLMSWVKFIICFTITENDQSKIELKQAKINLTSRFKWRPTSLYFEP
jgi:hypothetical protein